MSRRFSHAAIANGAAAVYSQVYRIAVIRSSALLLFVRPGTSPPPPLSLPLFSSNATPIKSCIGKLYTNVTCRNEILLTAVVRELVAPPMRHAPQPESRSLDGGTRPRAVHIENADDLSTAVRKTTTIARTVRVMCTPVAVRSVRF